MNILFEQKEVQLEYVRKAFNYFHKHHKTLSCQALKKFVHDDHSHIIIFHN
jgi:hypothetical protein